MRHLLNKILSKLRVSRLAWHDLKSIHPISRMFGLDRGAPIDRYYIENFLSRHRTYIRGSVLEVADSRYTQTFGSHVTAYEVLHVEKSDQATIIGDLTKSDTLPANHFDCFICTQVLNFIFDFPQAIAGIHQVLKPGGIVLATVSGISQVSRYDADRWGHFWSFYPQGIERAFKKVFGDDNVTIQTFGNSLAAISFVKGIAQDELSKEELDFNDPDYPVSITICARKA